MLLCFMTFAAVVAIKPTKSVCIVADAGIGTYFRDWNPWKMGKGEGGLDCVSRDWARISFC